MAKKLDVNDQLDELLASFESTGGSPSVPSSKRVSTDQPMDDFDFLDNFLAEMEAEKKPKPSPTVAPRAAAATPAKSSPSSSRPSTRADDFLSELEEMVSTEKEPAPKAGAAVRSPVASPWKAVDQKLPAKPKEISLDTSKDIRQLRKELEGISIDAAKKKGEEDDDLAGFEVAKVKSKVATKAVSLDSPEELELLQAEMMGPPPPLPSHIAAEQQAQQRPQQQRQQAQPVQQAQQDDYSTRAKAQPQRRPVVLAGGQQAQQAQQPQSPHGMKKPLIVQQAQPVPVPVPMGVAESPKPKPSPRQQPQHTTPASAGGDSLSKASIADLDRLLDEISPATIKRFPGPQGATGASRGTPTVTAETFQPPSSSNNVRRDASLDEMDALVGELDLNLNAKPMKRRPSLALNSLDDLDEVEKALGVFDPKPKPQPARSAPPPAAAGQSAEDRVVDDVMGRLDSVVEHTQQSKGSRVAASPIHSPQISSSDRQLREKAQQIAQQIKTSDQGHDYVSGFRQGGSGGSLDDNKQKAKQAETNLDLILEGIDPQIHQRRLEQEKREKEAKEKKDAELSGLVSGLDEQYKAKQEMERKRKEQEEAERRRKKEEEDRRRMERKKMDLEAIEEMVENLSPVGFLDVAVAGAAGTPATAVVTQNIRQHTEQTQEEKEYNRIQVKHKELARMTGQNLWTAKGDARIDISSITEFLKASVAEARVVAEERGITDPKKKDEIVENCKIALQTVPGFVSALKKFHGAQQAHEDAAKSGIPVDKTVVDNVLRECQVARMQLLKAYEILLESYLYSPNSTVTIKRATAVPLSVAGPGDAPIKLFKEAARVDECADAKNSILFAFRDFYVGANEKPPQPNTIEALSYVPWKPQFSMKEYCAQSIAQFKEIVNFINAPMKTFDFKEFAAAISKELQLLIPITKMITLHPERYGPFTKFPLGTKVFVNACINFIETVNVYKTKGVTAENLAMAKGDADFLAANTRKTELNNTLKMLLTVLQNILLVERS